MFSAKLVLKYTSFDGLYPPPPTAPLLSASFILQVSFLDIIQSKNLVKKQSN